MTHSLDKITRKATFYKQVTLTCLALLITTYTCRFFWLVPPPEGASPMVIWAIHAIPLMLFLPGIIHDKPRVYAWFCFILTIYFCMSVVTGFAVPHILGYLGIIESVLQCVIFISAMFGARWFGLLANNGISYKEAKKS